MHTRIPDLRGEELSRSLGFLAAWWIETFTIIGRGGGIGLPVQLNLEERVMLLSAYALDKYGNRRFQRVFYSRPKGCDKSGKGAAVAMFEAFGPCRFDHWAYEGETYEFLGQTYMYHEGEPVGRPVQDPTVLCLATAEGQTGNVFDSIYYNCDAGPLSELRGYGLNVTKVAVELPQGGKIMPMTSSAGSKDGGLETFVVADETHLYNRPRLHAMYQTVSRNLAKRKMDAEPWILETSTMYAPGEESVAEGTYRAAWDWAEGKIKRPSQIYFDHRFSDITPSEFVDEKRVRSALIESYGPTVKSADGKDHLLLADGRMTVLHDDGFDDEGHSFWDGELGPAANGWIDIQGQLDDIYMPDSAVEDSIRYYMNNITSKRDAWLDEASIQSHLLHEEQMRQARIDGRLDNAWQQFINRNEPITLGFDGSVSNDSTALVGCRISDGMLFLVKLDQCPEGPEGAHWKVDRDAFDKTVRYMLKHYTVKAMFADCAYFESMIGGWETDYGSKLVTGPRGRGSKIKFYTNNWSNDMYRATENAATAFRYDYEPVHDSKPVKGDIALLADPRLLNHFRNARVRAKSYGYAVYKETPKSPNKIDACVAGILAYAARQKVLENDAPVKRQQLPFRVY